MNGSIRMKKNKKETILIISKSFLEFKRDWLN